MSSSKNKFMELREEEQQETNVTRSSPGNTGLTINATSFLSISKDDLRDKAMSVVDGYMDGFKSPTEGLILAKKMIDMGEMIKENLADAATNELRIGKGENRDVSGNKVTEQMVGVRWNYKDCGDPVWNDLNEKIKEREKFLQSIKGSKEEYIPETQEVVRILEPTKSGKLSLIIKY